MSSKVPKFLVDSMAGKLARRLRMLGFDAEYERTGNIQRLIARAKDEDRIILTRNLRFKKVHIPKGVRVVFLRSELTPIQVRQVIDEFGLREHIRPFTRCVECNEPLVEIKDKEEVRGKVPFYVFQTHEEFSMCPKCRRIYWKGTHVEAMRDMLSRILGMEIEGNEET
ncbi:MAG: hypothetical protein DRQ10_06010 [Candidatus Hydrothermota bacterium]|nr:MAG: hypothetical protein DRQ10_06010 [Candidatus Hydrothermae bacterium]